MYANTGLHTRCAQSQFRACELPVHTRVYADRVMPPCAWFCTLSKYFPIVILSYIILYYIEICDSC